MNYSFLTAIFDTYHHNNMEFAPNDENTAEEYAFFAKLNEFICKVDPKLEYDFGRSFFDATHAKHMKGFKDGFKAGIHFAMEMMNTQPQRIDKA